MVGPLNNFSARRFFPRELGSILGIVAAIIGLVTGSNAGVDQNGNFDGIGSAASQQGLFQGSAIIGSPDYRTGNFNFVNIQSQYAFAPTASGFAYFDSISFIGAASINRTLSQISLTSPGITIGLLETTGSSPSEILGGRYISLSASYLTFSETAAPGTKLLTEDNRTLDASVLTISGFNSASNSELDAAGFGFKADGIKRDYYITAFTNGGTNRVYVLNPPTSFVTYGNPADFSVARNPSTGPITRRDLPGVESGVAIIFRDPDSSNANTPEPATLSFLGMIAGVSLIFSKSKLKFLKAKRHPFFRVLISGLI